MMIVIKNMRISVWIMMMITAGLSACGDSADTPPSQLRAASDACQKIDKLEPAVCDCRAGTIASKLGASDFEVYSWYRAHWAGDVLYPDAPAQAANAAAERFQRTPEQMAMIAAAETTYADDLKACDSKH